MSSEVLYLLDKRCRILYNIVRMFKETPMDQDFTHSEDDEIVDVAEDPSPFPYEEAPEGESEAPAAITAEEAPEADEASEEPSETPAEEPAAEPAEPAETPAEPLSDETDEDEEKEDEDKEHTISSDLIRGHINTIILRSLYDGDKYGYAIIEEIARKSHNQYQLKQPSLYSALKRLEKEGYITSYWGGTAGGGRRKYFSLTDQGKEIAERNLMEWEYSRTVIDSLISDKDFDFAYPAPSPVDMRVLKQSTSRVPSGHGDEYDDTESLEPMSGTTDEPAQATEPAAYAAPEDVADSMPDLSSEETDENETVLPVETAEPPAQAAPEAEEPAPEQIMQEIPEEQEAQTAEQPAAAAFPSLSEPAPDPENTFAAAPEETAEPVSEPAPEETAEPVSEAEAAAAASEAPEANLEPAAEPLTQLPEDHPAMQELNARRAAFEEEQRRAEEELRAREEMLKTREELFRSEEQQRNRMIAEAAAQNRYWEEMRARDQARLEEEQRRRMEAEAIARLRYEDELRRIGEERRAQEEARIAAEEAKREQERLEEEERRRAEAAERERQRLEEEQRLAREEEERRAREEARLEEERAHAAALNDEKTQQNARIMEMQPFLEERAKYEQMMRDREEQLKARHARELAEQEERIRHEDEERFREREQQMIHQNYLSLVNTPPVEEPQTAEYNYFNTPVVPAGEAKTPMYAAKPEAEREYRAVIGKLYSNTLKEEPAPQPEPAPAPAPQPVPQVPVQQAPAEQTYAPPAPAPQPKPAQHPAPQRTVVRVQEAAPKKAAPQRPAPAGRSLDGVDFYDLEMRASADGIRITTSGGGTKPAETTLSVNLVHKGKALFFSALTVFLLCIAEGSVTLGLLRTLQLPRFYPYLIWGAGLAVLLVCGLAYVNHYGERALRRTGNLLVNTIVTYALCVIVILIISLAGNIDFTNLSQLMTYVVIPIVFFLNIVIFAVVYYFQVRPKNE